MNELKIVFMGTPDFAVTILDGLIQGGANVIATITAPDKPAGRGRKISESAVKSYAVANNIKILQPTNLKDEEFLNTLNKLSADLFIVVAFRMLPEVVWTMPPKGTINLHGSLLPQYRGAAPINWAIINGESKTGVTTFFIEKEIDTGKVIHSSELSISKNMTAGELHDELAALGAQTMIMTVNEIEEDSVTPIDQSKMVSNELKPAPKIFKPDCKIDWNLSKEAIHNFIRGLDPYPGAWSKVEFKGKDMTCKFFGSLIKVSTNIDGVENPNKSNSFVFHCSNGDIFVSEIQIEGKRRMNFKDFTAGNDINDLKLV